MLDAGDTTALVATQVEPSAPGGGVYGIALFIPDRALAELPRLGGAFLGIALAPLVSPPTLPPLPTPPPSATPPERTLDDSVPQAPHSHPLPGDDAAGRPAHI